jgi:hypothetical protein
MREREREREREKERENRKKAYLEHSQREKTMIL